jgi:hypothetical protein
MRFDILTIPVDPAGDPAKAIRDLCDESPPAWHCIL